MPLTPASALLTDRLVLVTGAAQGIGAAVAGACARFGADLVLCDRDADGLARTAANVEASGRRAVTAVLDVRDGDAVRDWVGTLPRLDVLVNNAGGGFRAAFLDVNDKGQDSLVRENFTSVTHFVRAAVPLMPTDGRASVINITSIEAHRAAPGFAIYSAMKAALVSLTKSLALELGDRRIRVNCIAPDVIPTPGVGGDLVVKTPLPVSGHTDDVAGAVIFLASDLGRFVTGTTVHVDGGNLAAGGWGRALDGSWVTAGEEAVS
jgi:NAD(P)-dependent dehydrogenase (short-subunit alcohol dehydrogenase family)